MCTTINQTAAVSGSAKGADGWFAVREVSVGYDHPVHAAEEHAILVDFVDRQAGPRARVAVELTRDSARRLVEQLAATLELADDYERSLDVA